MMKMTDGDLFVSYLLRECYTYLLVCLFCVLLNLTETVLEWIMWLILFEMSLGLMMYCIRHYFRVQILLWFWTRCRNSRRFNFMIFLMFSLL